MSPQEFARVAADWSEGRGETSTPSVPGSVYLVYSYSRRKIDPEVAEVFGSLASAHAYMEEHETPVLAHVVSEWVVVP